MTDESLKKKYTIFGFITILIWGTSAVFTRNLSTNLGAYTSASVVNIIGGIIVLAKQFKKEGGIKGWRSVPLKCWLICGSMFVIYTATSYVSICMVAKEEAVVTLVLIRFLWPLFTLVLTIPILKEKASKWLCVGVAFCIIGIIIAKLGDEIFDMGNFVQNIVGGDELPAYLMGFVVAISWALYTNYTKKFAQGQDVDGAGIYMLVSGIILGIIALNVDEPRNFSVSISGQVLYAAIVVSSIANVMWNSAIKKGNMLVVVLASNFLPIISTVMTAWMLGVKITVPIIIGSAFVVAGTLFSKKCFVLVD